MTHLSEAEFEDVVAKWYKKNCKTNETDTTVYQPDVRWFVDIVIQRPDLTIYAEVENDAKSVRDGTGQALAYAGADPIKGVPMVIVPKDHKDDDRVEQMRAGSRCRIRAFDAAKQEWVQPD